MRIPSRRFEKLRRRKFVFIPALIVAGILIAASGVYFYQSSQTPKAEVADQPLKAEGLNLSVKVTALSDPKSSTIKGGESVKVVLKLDNSSNQHSRFLTVKSGLESANFTFIRNVAGATGYADEDGQITFKNVVVQAGQSQEISFEAIAFSFDTDKEFEIKPSLIDTTQKTVLFGKSAKYTVTKSNNSPGNAATATAEGVE